MLNSNTSPRLQGQNFNQDILNSHITKLQKGKKVKTGLPASRGCVIL
jgi:hypothetical protein